MDLERFFDRVNWDILMGKLARRIEDKRVLRVIRRYLEAGVMVNGVVLERHEGTPQGGPISPLLANVLLDGVDKEPERRGHAFVRYADDGNVYNFSSRRMRTRFSGGVGGERRANRRPLSRLVEPPRRRSMAVYDLRRQPRRESYRMTSIFARLSGPFAGAPDRGDR